MPNPEAREKFLTTLPGYILLIRKPGDLKVYGPVENSFSLSVEEGRTYFFWTNQSTDGLKEARESREFWKKHHPEWIIDIYDARSEDLPVVLNWALWLDAHESSDQTFAGVKNKHEARNLRFVLKGLEPDTRTNADALKGVIRGITF